MNHPLSMLGGIVFVSLLLILHTSCQTDRMNPKESDYPVYEKEDLGLTFSETALKLKVWSPKAEAMRLKIYAGDLDNDQPPEVIDMRKIKGGVWEVEIDTAFTGEFYTVQAKHGGTWSKEVPDPYAWAVGRNGRRGQFIDPSSENPHDWKEDRPPDFSKMNPNDFLIYEVHVRDFSISENSGMEHGGKFIAFTERGTKNTSGLATGVDHLVEMGVTHVHLLPSFDFYTVDETRLDEPQYNWGYDPQNYNVPEGSYSTDPANGATRIREFKAMVKALHDAGIGVVMDVVYNHTSRTEGLSFEELVPGYYYRHWNDSTLSDASGCGNETASERPMMRKFMVESLKHWVEEYHIDGFRFDLMAIHDLETMQIIEKELRRIHPNILLYGEGWTAADSPLPAEDRALKKHTYRLPGVAAFSDEIRDGLKGHWSDHKSKGFVSGNSSLRESVKFGIVGGIDHPDVDYGEVNNSDTAWAAEPHQCVVYVSCHDNHTLYDKLKVANPEATEEEIRKMHLLSNFVVLTSQGIPFLHAGVEFLRTKDGVENSYQSPDSINRIDWDAKTRYSEHVEAYRNLIALRKAHPSFRLTSAQEIRKRLRFLESNQGVIAYEITSPETDTWKKVMVAINGSGRAATFSLSDGNYVLVYPVEREAAHALEGKLPAHTACILAEMR
jgi:pullulanase